MLEPMTLPQRPELRDLMADEIERRAEGLSPVLVDWAYEFAYALSVNGAPFALKPAPHGRFSGWHDMLDALAALDRAGIVRPLAIFKQRRVVMVAPAFTPADARRAAGMDKRAWYDLPSIRQLQPPDFADTGQPGGAA